MTKQDKTEGVPQGGVPAKVSGMFKLPTWKELLSDSPELIQQNELNVLLNQQPPETWLRKHPTAKREVVVKGEKKTVPVEYVPIERVKYLMNRLFIKHRIEVLDSKVIANSIVVTVRVHYLNPITLEWDWHDGIGAAPVNTRSGAGATDLSAVLTLAVQQAAPSAKSYAVKDACHEIGKLFGRDINNSEDINYDTLLYTFPNKEELRRRVGDIIQGIENDEERTAVVEGLMEVEGTPGEVDMLNAIIERYGKPE